MVLVSVFAPSYYVTITVLFTKIVNTYAKYMKNYNDSMQFKKGRYL